MAPAPIRFYHFVDESLLGSGEVVANSKLQARLKSNHTRGAVAAEADAEQAGGRCGRVSEGAETGLRFRLAGNAGQNHAGQSEIRMVEHGEELAVYAQL